MVPRHTGVPLLLLLFSSALSLSTCSVLLSKPAGFVPEPYRALSRAASDAAASLSPPILRPPLDHAFSNTSTFASCDPSTTFCDWEVVLAVTALVTAFLLLFGVVFVLYQRCKTRP